MEINNNRRINNITIQKKDSIDKRPLAQHETKDLSNCPNPTEYLGRSQVVFRGKTEPIKKQLPKYSKEDLTPIELKESPILSKEDMISILNEFGFKDNEIAQIDFNDENNIRKISGLKAYIEIDEIAPNKEIYFESIRNSTPEEREHFIESELPDSIIYFNQENLDTLKKYIDFNMNDVWELYENIFDGDNKDEVLRIIPLTSMAQGKLTPENIETLRYISSYDNKITLERADILRRINELSPENKKLPIAQCSNLGTDEDLTDEKVNEYLNILERYGQKEFFAQESLLPTYQGKNLKEITEDVAQIENILEKYPLDFSLTQDASKLSIRDLQNITQREDIENIQKYLNSLIPEARTFAIYNLPKQDSKIDKTKLAQIHNTIFDKDYGKVDYYSLNEFLDKQGENDYKDLDSIIKVINRYKGTDALNTSYIEEAFTFGGNDYDSAITALDLKDEINSKNLNLNPYSFSEILHNPETDLKNMNKILTYIRDNNIDGESYSPNILSDSKGYNKIALRHHLGEIIDSNDSTKKNKLNELGDILNNDEEINYAVDLIKQKPSPNSENYQKRFDLNFDVKEIMQSYQKDKESTKAIVDMKDDNDNWRITDKQDIMPTIEAYQLDKDTTLDILNLKNEVGFSRFNDGAKIKSLVETAQIDKDYTFEIINKKNAVGDVETTQYRFDDVEKIKDIVTASQIDKDFTNYLLDLSYKDNLDTDKYRITDSKDYIYFAQKAFEGDKELTTSLLEMKGSRFDKTKGVRLSTDAVKAILDNPKENREFLTDLIKKETKSGNYEYSSYEILQLAMATKIDKDFTESLLNEKPDSDGFTSKRFDRTDEILKVLESTQIDKELTTMLLNAKKQNSSGEFIPRFNGKDIKSLVETAQNYNRDDVINIVNMTTTSRKGYIEERFNASGIKTVVEALSKERELIEDLLKTTVKWSDGTIRPYYDAYDIYYIISATEIDKDFALSILNDKEVKRSGEDIYYLTQSSIKDKKTTIALHKMTYLDSKGIQQKRLRGVDIDNLVSLANGNSEFLLEQTQNKIKVDGKTVYRFSAKNLETVVDAYNTNPKLTKVLIDRAKEDKDGNTTNVLSPHDIYTIANNITYEKYEALEKQIGDNIDNYTCRDILTATDFPELYNVNSPNEIPIAKKKDFLKHLVSCNANLFQTSEYIKKDFPLIPTTAEEYCSLLPSVVRSLGIETNELTDDKIDKFNENITNLTEKLSDLSDNDLEGLEISQEYPSNKFITDVLTKLDNSNLSDVERQKVFDYYGFELHQNPNNPTGYSIVGYPVNLNNGKKLAEINDENTKKVVEDIQENVKEFSENNKIKANNNTVQNLLNDICDVLPEIHKAIGKNDDSLHNGDMIKNSLKVLQQIGQNKDYQKLNDSDKKIMQIAALMHNIAKAEGFEDKMNAKESSFDTYFIAKKFKLSKDEEIKLYTLIKTSDWLDKINSNPDNNKKELQSIAFDLQQNNNFDMAKIFAEANVETLNSESSKETLKGNLAILTPKIEEYVHELKTSQPLLPVTKMPKASSIEKNISQVNPDGSTNIKGVYKDANGLVVVKFNEVENWEELGLPKGTTTAGIKAKAVENIKGEQVESETDTGNIKFFVHGLDHSNQLAKFDAFSLADSDVLLSVSYAERPETKYRFFRPQGIMLDVPSDYVYGGGNTDSGSGCGKFVNEFKSNYIFGGCRESDRKYISNLIKEETGMSDEEYIKFVENNKDKAMHEIEPKELQTKIVQKLATINSNHRKGNRAYNEMYISNPREIMGVFAYSMKDGENIEEPLKFLEEQNHRTEFLKKYALEHDVPFYVFGD